MTRPAWHDAWQEAFEEGFDETETERLTHPAEKKAVAVRRNEDGTTDIVRTASGADALKMIADAKARGLSVEQSADQVESLMTEQTGATDVPPEVYRLMSAVIDFAQELCQEYKSAQNESLLDDGPKLVNEVEYTLDDLGQS